MTAGSANPHEAASGQAPSLLDLLAELPCGPDDVAVSSETGDLSLRELEACVDALARTLAQAGVAPGQPVGNLVVPGPGALVAMFAVWRVGGVYVPINRRYTAQEVGEFLAETPVALVIGAPADLDAHELTVVGTVTYDHPAAQSAVRARARADAPRYEPDVAFVLRTSGTTGRPKAVLIRHSGTIDALDASLVELRGASAARPQPATGSI